MTASILVTMACRSWRSSSEMPCSCAASCTALSTAFSWAGEGGGKALSSFSSCFSCTTHTQVRTKIQNWSATCTPIFSGQAQRISELKSNTKNYHLHISIKGRLAVTFTSKCRTSGSERVSYTATLWDLPWCFSCGASPWCVCGHPGCSPRGLSRACIGTGSSGTPGTARDQHRNITETNGMWGPSTYPTHMQTTIVHSSTQAESLQWHLPTSDLLNHSETTIIHTILLRARQYIHSLTKALQRQWINMTSTLKCLSEKKI